MRIDGIIRGSTPITIPITPGKHRVHLERPGFEKADAVVDVPPASVREVELTMNKLARATKPVVTAADEEHTRRPPKGSYRKYALGAARRGGRARRDGRRLRHRRQPAAPGGAGRRSVGDHARRHQQEARHRRQLRGGRVYRPVVGGAALLAAAIVFIVDPSRGESHAKQTFTPTAQGPQKKKRSNWVLSPTMNPGGAGIAAAGSF